MRVTGKKPWLSSLRIKKLIHVDMSFAKDGPEDTFSHVFGMVWERGFSPRQTVPPDLVAAGAGAIKTLAEGA